MDTNIQIPGETAQNKDRKEGRMPRKEAKEGEGRKPRKEAKEGGKREEVNKI